MKKHVLLIEDNPDDHYQVKWALREFSEVELKIAVNGEEGVNYLLSHEQQPPALVFLDLKMPKMGGNEALCKIRAREALTAVPVVIFSSSIEPSDIAEAKRCQATEFVQKPVDFEKYNETVRRLVRTYVGLEA
jgi:CheY-like chemotaxis protein